MKYQDVIPVTIKLDASGAVTDNTSTLKTATKKLTVKVNIATPSSDAKVKITKIEPAAGADAPDAKLSWKVPANGDEQNAGATVAFADIDATDADAAGGTVLAAGKKLKVTVEVSKPGRETVTKEIEVTSAA